MPKPPTGQLRSAPLPAGAQPIAQAIKANEALSALSERIQASRDRLVALQPFLPTAMRLQIQAGPIDNEGYTLLTDSPAVATKLRYLLPTLEQSLLRLGWTPLPIRVRVMSRR